MMWKLCKDLFVPCMQEVYSEGRDIKGLDNNCQIVSMIAIINYLPSHFGPPRSWLVESQSH